MYSRLLRDRIIVLDTPVEDSTATYVCGQLLYLEKLNPVEAVQLYINSPGGVITAGLAIYDTMKYVSCPVVTLCFGQAASMAAILLASGDRRLSLPHSRIMIHQPSGGYVGKSSDIQIHADEINRLKEILLDILEQHTMTDRAKLAEMLGHDTYMSPDEAIQYGLIDGIVRSKRG